jgi:hypothetical protein
MTTQQHRLHPMTSDSQSLGEIAPAPRSMPGTVNKQNVDHAVGSLPCNAMLLLCAGIEFLVDPTSGIGCWLAWFPCHAFQLLIAVRRRNRPIQLRHNDPNMHQHACKDRDATGVTPELETGHGSI